jgi:hypothetical protein
MNEARTNREKRFMEGMWAPTNKKPRYAGTGAFTMQLEDEFESELNLTFRHGRRG